MGEGGVKNCEQSVDVFYGWPPLLIWNGADGLEKMANAMTADA